MSCIIKNDKAFRYLAYKFGEDAAENIVRSYTRSKNSEEFIFPTVRQALKFIQDNKDSQVENVISNIKQGDNTTDNIIRNLKGIVTVHDGAVFITKGWLDEGGTALREEQKKVVFDENYRRMQKLAEEYPTVFEIKDTKYPYTKVVKINGEEKVEVPDLIDLVPVETIEEKIENEFFEQQKKEEDYLAKQEGIEEIESDLGERSKKNSITVKPGVEELFDKELAQKIQDKLEKLYPEIKLNITNNPVWEQGNDVLNQEEYDKEVAYRLKAVEILLSDKAKQIFEKGNKNNWDLNKILTELAVSKDQKQLILDSGKTNIEDIITNLLANYSYTVEINTAKERDIAKNLKTVDNNFSFNGINYTSENIPNTFKSKYSKDGIEISKEEYLDAKIAKQNEVIPLTNTQIYSNLTVPGGTNYTEQEIATPNITPSIKGHAQFATDKGIGWFRSDEQITFDSGMSEQEEAYYNPDTDEMVINDKGRTILGGKTRRILEVQSDLFQKGRDKKDLVTTTRMQGVGQAYSNLSSFTLDGIHYYSGMGIAMAEPEDGSTNSKKISFKEYEEAKEKWINKNSKKDSTENQFLQLLNKNNNWVTFFVKSIIQDSAKKGYEKVLFPTGNTASKVEGHSTLEDFKQQKENRIKELEKQQLIYKNVNKVGDTYKIEDNNGNIFDRLVFNEKALNDIETIKKANQSEINRLKQELERVETEGFGALKPIFNFYETTVANVLRKQGYSPKQVTDEYGNTWNEITINQARELQNVLLQKNEANRIIGQANIKAMSVLVDAVNQKQDTLPHEYAHHYIAWFRNTPIVQEAIKKWGSEEALVQSIGEQVVKQKGEAYNWWNNFVKWIMNQFNSLSKLQKEELTQILTDAFLTRQNLGSKQDIEGFKKFVEEENTSNEELTDDIKEFLSTFEDNFPWFSNLTLPERIEFFKSIDKDEIDVNCKL